MQKSGFFILLIILICPIVAAGELAVSISPNNPSLSLNHGQSTSLTLTIANDNDLCSIQCGWRLLKNNQESVNEGTFTASAGTQKAISLSLTAPTKSEAKQEKGTIEYLLSLECAEINEWYNACSGTDTETNIISLNYDLTQQDKDVRDYLKPQLEEMRSLLQEVESKKYTAESKIEKLPKNVLASDLKARLTEDSSSYSTLKSSYENINSMFGKLDFMSARNSFNSEWASDLNQIRSSLDSLDIEIETRLARHNEIIKELNELQEKFNSLKVKSQIANAQIDSVETQVNELTNNFEVGKFANYDDIENSINSIEAQINELTNKAAEDISTVLEDGKSLIALEQDKINQKENLLSDIGNDIDALKEICTAFKYIEEIFKDENKISQATYKQKLSEITMINSNLESINKELSIVIELRNNISKMVNENGIKEFDSSICQEELIKIKSGGNLSREINYAACQELQSKLMKAREQKSGFWFSLTSFFRKFWFDSVKFEKISLLKEQQSPESPPSLDLEEKSRNFGTQYCNINLTIDKGVLSSVSSVKGSTLTKSDVDGVIQNENQCCVFGICQKCCEGNSCLSDSNSYPVIFLHGHSFAASDSPDYSLDAFNEIQLSLFQDKYRIGGTFLPNQQKSSIVEGEWGRVNYPITVKATYYLGVYNAEGEMISVPSKQESISTYAQRLGEVIDLVKYRTGRDKVNIVAHSMGGLVAREYIKNYGGESSVNKLVMVGTPNHGIYGEVDSFCSLRGANTECAQMSNNSSFMNTLNSNDETYGSVQYYTIAGSGCILSGIDGDGISRVDSVQLNGATNVKVSGKCEGTFNRNLHSDLLNPDKYPETYNYIKQFLK